MKIVKNYINGKWIEAENHPAVDVITTRQLWQNILDYGSFDRMPVIHWSEWAQTRQRWIKEGMPEGIDEHQYFNAVPHWFQFGVNLDIFPPFDEKTFEETQEWRIFRDHCGIVQKAWKSKDGVPHYMDFTLKGRNEWEDYKKRLQPDRKRIPLDFENQLTRAEESHLPIGLWLGSLMGWIRNWMGIENMSYLMYDDPDVYGDMVDTLATLACWGIDQVVPRMKTLPNMGHLWEDICGKNGPLVSPNIFRKYVAPGYRKIRQKLETYDIRLLSIDSDGDVSQLVSLWMDAGVNILVPFEIGTWKADPMAYRRKYGKELRVIGGFNKLELEKGPAAIDAEIERRLPVMKEGGYVISPDHAITPGTSLENYRYYLEKIRSLRL